jgi:cobalt-zinc-cadmium efflux system membrane fusion protein
MMRRHSVFTCLALLAAACGHQDRNAEVAMNAPSADSIHLGEGNPKLPFIKIEVVTESDGGTSMTLTGRVDFDEDKTQRVASPIDGRAASLLVSPGDRVKAGQALIQLSSPQVGQLQAEALKAGQDLTVAQKALDRANKLQADGAISDKEVAQIEADYRKAKSDAESSTAQLRALGISPSDPTVTVALRAQVPGTVVERNVLVGQEVRADGATPLVTISDLETVWVLADVYEQDLKLVQQGASVNVRVPAYPDQVFAGTVAHIGDVLDPASHTVKLRCVVPNSEHKLKPEMFAKIELAGTAGGKAIFIPSKAVLADSEHSRVIVDSGGGTFKTRVVSVGPETEGKVRVLGGLVAGERIVTDGALFLQGDIVDQ